MHATNRCLWCGTDPLYVQYHDTEWGVPERDPRALWECLMLEGFQAGLNWITILRKRDSFRAAFAGFQPEIIAKWGEPEIAHLLQDPGIVRHRGKIEATIAGAKAWLRIEAQAGFSAFIWKFADVSADPADPIPSQTRQSEAMSKALKREGFKFCGPTITYAFMQAVGLVNDHAPGCFRHAEVAR